VSELPNPAPLSAQCDCAAVMIPRDWVRERLGFESVLNVVFEVVV
jgi:hypothetical protein